MIDSIVQQIASSRPTSSSSSSSSSTSDHDDDIFATLARTISACSSTRDDGGVIGWVEGINDNDGGSSSSSSSSSNNNRNDLLAGILPADVITAVYDKQPKPGDVLVLHSPSTEQWHCIQVMEAWMRPPILMDRSSSGDTATSTARIGDNDEYNNDDEDDMDHGTENNVVGAHRGSNSLLKRPKLKGAGVLPVLPSNMTTYTIQTSGCQMNVADSERLEGILQDQLHLIRASKPSEADLVLLNTCRYVICVLLYLFRTDGPGCV